MKRFLKTLTGIAALLALLATPTFAQDKEKEKAKEKNTKNDHIIISRKSDKDAKITIEIKGDEVLVNGKPADEYEDENVKISKQHGYTILSPRTPFRSQSGSWSFNGNEFNMGEYAFLGVVTEDHEKGVKIESVTDESAAEKGGLKAGDVITKIDESVINKPDDLTKAIRKHKPEEKATITYLRDGKEQKATVTLGKRNGLLNMYGDLAPRVNVNPNFDLNFDNGAFNRTYSFSGRPRLGVKAQDTEDGKGVKVIGIDEESIAEKAGLKEGDVITEFDGKSVNDTDALTKAARDSREKSTVTVKYNRDGKSQTAELKTPKKLKTTNL
jgi:serine protease Do